MYICKIYGKMSFPMGPCVPHLINMACILRVQTNWPCIHIIVSRCQSYQTPMLLRWNASNTTLSSTYPILPPPIKPLKAPYHCQSKECQCSTLLLLFFFLTVTLTQTRMLGIHWNVGSSPYHPHRDISQNSHSSSIANMMTSSNKCLNQHFQKNNMHS